MIEPRPELRKPNSTYCLAQKERDIFRMKTYLLQENNCRERIERYKKLGAEKWLLEPRKKQLLAAIQRADDFARLVNEKHNFDVRKTAIKRLEEEGKLS